MRPHQFKGDLQPLRRAERFVKFPIGFVRRLMAVESLKGFIHIAILMVGEVSVHRKEASNLPIVSATPIRLISPPSAGTMGSGEMK